MNSYTDYVSHMAWEALYCAYPAKTMLLSMLTADECYLLAVAMGWPPLGRAGGSRTAYLSRAEVQRYLPPWRNHFTSLEWVQPMVDSFSSEGTAHVRLYAVSPTFARGMSYPAVVSRLKLSTAGYVDICTVILAEFAECDGTAEAHPSLTPGEWKPCDAMSARRHLWDGTMVTGSCATTCDGLIFGEKSLAALCASDRLPDLNLGATNDVQEDLWCQFHEYKSKQVQFLFTTCHGRPAPPEWPPYSVAVAYDYDISTGHGCSTAEEMWKYTLSSKWECRYIDLLRTRATGNTVTSDVEYKWPDRQGLPDDMGLRYGSYASIYVLYAVTLGEGLAMYIMDRDGNYY